MWLTPNILPQLTGPQSYLTETIDNPFSAFPHQQPFPNQYTQLHNCQLFPQSASWAFLALSFFRNTTPPLTQMTSPYLLLPLFLKKCISPYRSALNNRPLPKCPSTPFSYLPIQVLVILFS